MLDWKVLAIVSPLFFATYQSISKLLPKTSSIFLVNSLAFLVGSIFMLTLHLLFSQNKELTLNTKSIYIAVGIGILLSLGNITIIKAYTLGAPQSIFSIISYVALIVFGIIFGVLFWQEKLTLPIIFGTTLALSGILIIIYYKK